MLRGVAGFYAQTFGVPTVMANKAAAGQDTFSPVPWVPLVRFRFHNLGQSTICDADGKVCDQLDEREGVAFAEVVLDPARKRRPARLPSGYWSRPPRLFPRTTAAVFQLMERIGKAAYTLSRSRQRAARERASTGKTVTFRISGQESGLRSASQPDR